MESFRRPILKVLLIWLAVIGLLGPTTVNGATYYVNPRGLWVPGQSAGGYFDQGQVVAVGKIYPVKLVVMGGY
jgi:hypothetical protein